MLVRHRALALITTGVAVVACGTAVADAVASEPPRPVTGGNTTISVSSAAARSFASRKVSFRAVAPATRKNNTLTLPNRGGESVRGNLRIVSGGGLVFVHGSKRVSLTKLVLNQKTKTVVGTISGHRSAAVLTMGEIMGGSGGKYYVKNGPYSLTWTAAAAKALDHDLATTAFAANKRVLGSGKLYVRFD